MIQNNNLAGLINFANLVTVNSNGLTISSGPPPVVPTAGTLPANVTVTPTGSPSVFFGAGLTAAAPMTISVGPGAGNIIFNGANAGTINFAGGLSLNSLVAAPAPPLTSSSSTPPLLSSPAPTFILGAAILGLGSGATRPFGTIVASDQTPESNPEQQIESSGQSNSQTLLSAASNGLRGQLSYLERDFTTITATDELVKLPNQNGLVFASRDTIIQTGLANISIKKGSALLILQSGSELAIFNLHDESRGAVQATVDGTTFEVPLGRQLTVSTRDNPQFDKINPSMIGYRELSSRKHGDKHVFFSEFSPLSALTSVSKLLSPEDKYHQQIAKRMLKTAAAIYVLGQRAGKQAFKVSK